MLVNLLESSEADFVDVFAADELSARVVAVEALVEELLSDKVGLLLEVGEQRLDLRQTDVELVGVEALFSEVEVNELESGFDVFRSSSSRNAAFEFVDVRSNADVLTGEHLFEFGTGDVGNALVIGEEIPNVFVERRHIGFVDERRATFFNVVD